MVEYPQVMLYLVRVALGFLVGFVVVALLVAVYNTVKGS